MVKEVMELIAAKDSEVGEAIKAEYGRQRRNLELIASENIVRRRLSGKKVLRRL